MIYTATIGKNILYIVLNTDKYDHELHVLLLYYVPLFMYFVTIHAYLMRTISYYFRIDPINMFVYKSNTYHRKIWIGVFIILNILLAGAFAIRLAIPTQNTHYLLMIYLATDLILCSCFIPISIIKFLGKLKKTFPMLYENKRKVILSVSMSFTIWLLSRGIAFYLIAIYHKYEDETALKTAAEVFLALFYLIEYIPAFLIVYMLWTENKREIAIERSNDTTNVIFEECEIFTLDENQKESLLQKITTQPITTEHSSLLQPKNSSDSSDGQVKFEDWSKKRENSINSQTKDIDRERLKKFIKERTYTMNPSITVMFQ